MKIRKGFVSNSSSSSFCIIGLDIYKEGAKAIMHKIAKLEGKKFPDDTWRGDYYDDNWDYFEYGVSTGKHVNFYGQEGELYYLGVNAKEALGRRSLYEARYWFAKKLAEWYRFDVPVDLIDLHYGEMGSG